MSDVISGRSSAVPTKPPGAAGRPEPLYAGFKRSFPIAIDARELAEILEWAATGAWNNGWPDLCVSFQDQQQELLRQLVGAQHDISGNT